MKVKKYTGSSLEKIREVINKELGEDAVIISSKKTSKKGMVSFGKEYEVIAAADDAINVDEIKIDKKDKDIETLLTEQKQQYMGVRRSMKQLDSKLADVDELMEKLAKNQVSATQTQTNTIEELRNIHKEWHPIIMSAAKEFAGEKIPEYDDWHEAIASSVITAGGIMFRETPDTMPDIYVIAGPTGVGKTTTLAKLAAKCVLRDNLKVGLVTLDTFRVGAVEQLREYADLLGVEISVAFSIDELNKQLNNFSNKDVIFIDTPGRSQFDIEGIKNIAESLKTRMQLCVMLAICANVRAEDAVSIFEHYKTLSPAGVILTKTDEASRCDGITKLFDISKLPVVYLTDGQRVPEDLHPASPGVLASLIMNGSQQQKES